MIELQQLLEIKELPFWKRFQLRHNIASGRSGAQAPCFFDLVYVPKNEQGRPREIVDPLTKDKSYYVYTHEPRSNQEFETHMFGEFVYSLSSKKELRSILIDPFETKIFEKEVLCFSHLVFSPIKDSFTKHYLISSPEEAKPLLSLDPEDNKRFGIELVFYMLTNKNIPEESKEREDFLQEKIEELAFFAPRVPVKKGSGSFVAIILNLGHKMEENAFIRSYQTYDSYSDVIFINSSLDLRSGEFQQIQYDGNRIDTILRPLISWQVEKNASLQI